MPVDFSRRVNTQSYIVAKPDVEERALLADYFKEDVRDVTKLLPELDISLWPDFV
ncbi:hypothetical protein L0244_32725 [bacterium]|nr:hypothetical protein [bacterium]